MRDNTEIGSGVVVLMGQYQMPMPHLITEGRITGQPENSHVSPGAVNHTEMELRSQASTREKGWS